MLCYLSYFGTILEQSSAIVDGADAPARYLRNALIFRQLAGWYAYTDEPILKLLVASKILFNFRLQAKLLEVFYTITKRQSRIVCLYIPAYPLSAPSPNFPPHTMCTNRNASPISPLGKTPLTTLGPSGAVSSLSASCPTLLDDDITSWLGQRCSGAHPLNQRVAQVATFVGDTPAKIPFTVLFSHGNAVDIGQMAGFLQSLAYRFGVNIICYDYSGYGVSSGQRSEDNLYADAEAVLLELRQRFNVGLDRIVLYGQSIGTAPTVELATKYKVAGVVLHSPFMSGLRVVCPGTTRRFCFDPFTNINKVSRILSPTLIIHGTEDEIIGIHHGRELFTRLAHPLEPAWIEGAGHNDIELFSEYATRLDRFFNEDLAVNPTPITNTSVVTTEPSLHVQHKTRNSTVSATSAHFTSLEATGTCDRVLTPSSLTSSSSSSDRTDSLPDLCSESLQSPTAHMATSTFNLPLSTSPEVSKTTSVQAATGYCPAEHIATCSPEQRNSLDRDCEDQVNSVLPDSHSDTGLPNSLTTTMTSTTNVDDMSTKSESGS